MKKLIKVLALSLIVSLFGVVAVSSMLADPSEVQSPQTAIKFEVETGIRWNPSGVSEAVGETAAVGAFEVFNPSGIAYIASNVWVNPAGEVASDSDTGFYQATADARYKIMQDIPYTVPQIEETTRNEIKEFFSSGVRRALTATAVVYGRSCTLSNFPIVDGALLFESNAGTISNLRIENPTFSSGGAGVGLIARTNSGTIEDCIIKAGTLSVEDSSVGAISYSNTGTIQSNINHLNIISSDTLAAGIVATSTGGTISSNANYGTINNETTYSTHAAGIIAESDDNAQILSNANHASAITGGETACGILASNPPYANHANISGNSNSTQAANIKAKAANGETAQIYIGMPVSSGGGTGQNPNYDVDDATNPDYVPKYLATGFEPPEGIYYYDVDDVFLITNAVGLSKIGSNKYYDTEGVSTDQSLPRRQALTTSSYYILNPIVATLTQTLTLDNKGLVDGQGHLLTLGIATISQNSTLFSTINSGALVRNINLKVSDTTITSESGGIAYTNSGTIMNCKVEVGATFGQRFGSVSGFINSNGLVDNCRVLYLNCVGSAPMTTVGGVTIGNSGVMSNCFIEGTYVNGNDMTFGCISGQLSGGGVIIRGESRLMVSGSVRSSMGGIVGYMRDGAVIDSVFKGKLAPAGSGCVGGIVGSLNAYGSSINENIIDESRFVECVPATGGNFKWGGSVIVGCVNLGELVLTGNGSALGTNDVAGGLVGILQTKDSDANIIFSGNGGYVTNAVTITSEGVNCVVGGVIGSYYTGNSSYSLYLFAYNSMRISIPVGDASGCAGGIIGFYGYSSGTIRRIGPCDNLGSIPVRKSGDFGYTETNISIGGFGSSSNKGTFNPSGSNPTYPYPLLTTALIMYNE